MQVGGSISPILQQQASTQSLQQSSAQVQSAAQAEAASLQNPNISLQYTVGPNGQLVVSSATVTGTEVRVNGVRSPDADNLRTNTQSTEPGSLNNLQGPQIALSPTEEVDAYGLTEAEESQLQELSRVDLAVRLQEFIHFRTASGQSNGLINLETVTGPDGQQYAVAGSVSVGGTPRLNPEDAVRDAATIARAALAPSDGSATDFAVARSATGNATAPIVPQTPDSESSNVGSDDESTQNGIDLEA